MLTFTDLQNIATSISGLNDAASVTAFKRDINMGGTRFMAILGRPWDRMHRFTNQVAAQQYYSIPEDALRISDIIYSNGTTWTPLIQVADETQWRLMNQSTISGVSTHYFVRGNDEFGLYPIPSGSTAAGIEMVFEPKHVLLTQDDYTTGTITATNGSQTVTHSGTGFTAKMAGQYLNVTDGTDGNWYRIGSYVDASNLTLENYYQGTSGSGLTFRIGQAMFMPEEFQEAPVDYAMYRHFLTRGDIKQAAEFKGLFDSALELAQDVYGRSSSNQIVMAADTIRVHNPLMGTPTIDV